MYSAFQSNAFQSNAFQILQNVLEVIEGGIPGKHKKKKPVTKAKQRRFFIERKGEILVFANAEQAQVWTAAQQQLSGLAKVDFL